MSKIKKAYGLYLTLVDIKRMSEDIQSLDANEKTEVLIDIDGVVKKFTYKEFAEKLGFDAA